MPKLTIEITEKAHSVLKERAKSEERSLTQYITLLLDDITGVRHLLTNSYTCDNFDTTITTTPNTTQQPTPTTTPQPASTTKPTPPPRKRQILGGEETDEIEFYERGMTDPNNETYQKIKRYLMHVDPDIPAFTALLRLVDEDNLNAIINNYEYTMQKALDIPITHSLSRSEWKELIGCMK